MWYDATRQLIQEPLLTGPCQQVYRHHDHDIIPGREMVQQAAVVH